MQPITEPVPVPEIGRDWINSPELTLAGPRGKVVVRALSRQGPGDRRGPRTGVQLLAHQGERRARGAREFQIWRAFSNKYWPATYLIDARGYLRFVPFGEGDYQEAAKFPDPIAPLRDTDQPSAICHRVTPVMYLGHRRGKLANEGDFPQHREYAYHLPATLEEDTVQLDGAWFSGRTAARWNERQQALMSALTSKAHPIST